MKNKKISSLQTKTFSLLHIFSNSNGKKMKRKEKTEEKEADIMKIFSKCFDEKSSRV